MKHTLYIALAVTLLIQLSGCTKKQLAPVDYVHWVEDESNGLRQTKDIGDYQFTLQYKPLEYVVIKEKKEHSIATDELNKRMQELSEMQYYTLRVGSSDGVTRVMDIGGASPELYSRKVQYYSFEMQEYLKLIEGQDTLDCTLYHFERNFDLAPYVNIVVAFWNDTTKRASNRVFLYDDKLMGLGPVKFDIDNSAIEERPTLITY